MKNEKSEKQTGSDFTFLYWDDMVDISHEGYPSPCVAHAKEQDEEEAEKRMMIIMRNGNSGEHYFDYFNNHPSSANTSDEEEWQNIKWSVYAYRYGEDS